MRLPTPTLGLAGYALLGGLLAGAAGGWHFGSLHWKSRYTAIVVSQATASAEAAVRAAERERKQQEHYDAAITAISIKHQQDLASGAATAGDLRAELRNTARRLSRCLMPASAGTASSTHGADADPAASRELASAIEGVERATGSLADRALIESAQLTALQAERASLNRSTP